MMVKEQVQLCPGSPLLLRAVRQAVVLFHKALPF